jgi:3-oxoacyl-[acyl-carrier-protein] synthase II
VTGLGAVGPVGLEVPTAWRRVVEGESGIRRITQFPTDDFRVKIAGEAWGFDPLDYLSPKQARRADRNVQFALVAAMEALNQAAISWPLAGNDADATGTCIGSGAGCRPT